MSALSHLQQIFYTSSEFVKIYGMEAMDIFLATSRDLTYLIIHHPAYSVIGAFVILAFLLKFYVRLTLGIYDSDEDMTGKTVLITGASAGIGKATALDLAKRNARVLMACRNLEKGEKVAKEIRAATGNGNIVVKKLDLCSFKSVRKCAEDVIETEEYLHVLINNAGTADTDLPKRTEDGCETIMQANHLGHFLLTFLLLDLLKKSAPSRIINVASHANFYAKLDVEDLNSEKVSDTMTLYSNSKLANVLFTRELATRLFGTGVTVNVLHPGVVNTVMLSRAHALFGYLVQFILTWVSKTPEEGAQTTIYLAVHPDLRTTTGKYYADCKEYKLKGKALDKGLARSLFENSEKIVGVQYPKA